jgi:hypothetical protein
MLSSMWKDAPLAVVAQVVGWTVLVWSLTTYC